MRNKAASANANADKASILIQTPPMARISSWIVSEGEIKRFRFLRRGELEGGPPT
jgi:hypothetical protein